MFFPVCLDDAVLDLSLHWAKPLVDVKKETGRHIGDFSKWKDHDSYQAAFDRLLRDLKAQ